MTSVLNVEHAEVQRPFEHTHPKDLLVTVFSSIAGLGGASTMTAAPCTTWRSLQLIGPLSRGRGFIRSFFPPVNRRKSLMGEDFLARGDAPLLSGRLTNS